MSPQTLLSTLIAWPVLGAVVTWVFGRASHDTARRVALVAALGQVLLSAGVTFAYVTTGLTGKGIPGSFWFLVADGLSLPFVCLTAVLGVVAVCASWNVEESPGAHLGLLLLLVAMVTGVFLAGDLVLFYVFWEAVLVPMYFLIGVWGHENRKHAAAKFFVYTFAGSAFMLLGILFAVYATRQVRIDLALAVGLRPALEPVVFWLLAIGMLVKIPVVPFHTWLPDAHTEAPTAGSVLLAGVLLKMGGYGLLRLAVPIAPHAAAQAGPVLMGLGIAGIVYGSLMALAQSDLKRLVAYSSVAHMGFVTLAIGVGTPLARAAAVLGMVSHGLVSALLFLLVGTLGEAAGTRDVDSFGGVATRAPRMGAALTLAFLASAGLPALSGFPGEALAVLETFGRAGWWAAFAALGVVLSAAYGTWTLRRVAFGPSGTAAVEDLGGGIAVSAALLCVGIVALGVWPQVLVGLVEPVLATLGGR